MTNAKLFTSKPKRRIMIATLAFLCCLIWGAVGVNDARTAQAIGYAAFDFGMAVACCAYGLSFLKRGEAPSVWSDMGIFVVLGGPSLKDAIKGISSRGITSDGAISLIFVAFWVLLAFVGMKYRGRVTIAPPDRSTAL